MIGRGVKRPRTAGAQDIVRFILERPPSLPKLRGARPPDSERAATGRLFMRKTALIAAVAALGLLAGPGVGQGTLHLSAPCDADQRVLAGGEEGHGRGLRADRRRLPDGLPAAGRQLPGAAQQPGSHHRAEARRHHHDLRRRRDLRRGAASARRPPASRCWPATSTTRRRRTGCPSPARTSSRRATTSPPAWRRSSRRTARSTS